LRFPGITEWATLTGLFKNRLRVRWENEKGDCNWVRDLSKRVV